MKRIFHIILKIQIIAFAVATAAFLQSCDSGMEIPEEERQEENIPDEENPGDGGSEEEVPDEGTDDGKDEDPEVPEEDEKPEISVSLSAACAPSESSLTFEVKISGNADGWKYLCIESTGTRPDAKEIFDRGIQGEKTEVTLDGLKDNTSYTFCAAAYHGETLSDAAFAEGKTAEKATAPPDEEFRNRTVWVRGVNAPDFPGWQNIPTVNTFADFSPYAGKWVREGECTYETQWLIWKEGCGWYDSNKRAYGDKEPKPHDENMCWAATASNLLYWWMNLNRAYIEAYDREFGTEHSGYERPSMDFAPYPAEDGIFSFFRANFPNKGGVAFGPVNWFLNGNPKDTDYSGNPQGFDGFFSNVFSKDMVIAERITGMAKEKVNPKLKELLLAGKAIGITCQWSGMAHVVTAWGFEFDDEGYASAVYMTDNNDTGENPCGAAIRRYKIAYIYDDLTRTYRPAITVTSSLDGQYKDNPKEYYHEISYMTAVDLRQDVWARHYPDINP